MYDIQIYSLIEVLNACISILEKRMCIQALIFQEFQKVSTAIETQQSCIKANYCKI